MEWGWGGPMRQDLRCPQAWAAGSRPALLVVRESSAGPTHEPRPARLSLRTAGWAGGKRREGQATALSPMVTGFRAGCAERFAGQAPLRRPQPWVASAGVALDSPLPRPAATAMPRWDQRRVALAPRRGPHTWGASLTPFLICPRSPALQAGNEAPPAAPRPRGTSSLRQRRAGARGLRNAGRVPSSRGSGVSAPAGSGAGSCPAWPLTLGPIQCL